jgi:hypothetical protein
MFPICKKSKFVIFFSYFKFYTLLFYSSILRTIDTAMLKIALPNESNSSEVKLNVDNIAARVSDISLIQARGSEDFEQSYNTTEDGLASISISTKFTSKDSRIKPFNPFKNESNQGMLFIS